MKKILVMLLAIFSIMAFSGCTKTTTGITTTNEENTLTLVSVGATDIIREKLSEPVRTNLARLSQNVYDLEITTTETPVYTTDEVVNGIPYYDTVIASEQWLVIYLYQPEIITEQYIIDGVTINYPDGSQFKWQAITTEDGSPTGRKMALSRDGLRVYIPVTTSESTGEYTYTVEQIEYTYQKTDYVVSKNENTIDSIVMRVGNPIIQTSNNFYIIGNYDKENGIINLDNDYLDSMEMSMILNGTITINDNPEIEYTIENNTIILNSPLNRDFLKIYVEYSNGLGGFTSDNFYVTFDGGDDLNIYSYSDLQLVRKDYLGTLNIKNDITIPIDFISFNSYYLNITSITEEGLPISIYYDGDLELINFDGTYIGENRTSFNIDIMNINFKCSLTITNSSQFPMFLGGHLVTYDELILNNVTNNLN